MTTDHRKKLRSGFTTGAAAAAATKGALFLLLGGLRRKDVRIEFLSGGYQDIPVHRLQQEGKTVVCSVIKDAGDDPDVTNQAEIGVRVWIDSRMEEALRITGGEGVGRVTKPGLEISPGEPAITTGPRKMICNAASDVFETQGLVHKPVVVEVFVPRGAELARKTLNSRLGIVGGISILGTTGVVRPMSHDAYIATIRSSLSVARAVGTRRVFYTTGRRSERFAQGLWSADPEEAFIQIGDFFKMSLQAEAARSFDVIVLVVFFGKALKMAYGFPHTHAGKADLQFRKLSQWVREEAADENLAGQVLLANTARQAFYLLQENAPQVIDRVGREMVRSARSFYEGDADICSVILDFDGRVVFDSCQSTTQIGESPS